VKRTLTGLVLALVVIAVMAVTVGSAFAAQPQSGQPGLTEGKNGPPPFPHRG
jgi:hypothetical protein